MTTDPRLMALIRDTATITARYHIARQHADECRNGWPTSVIGASPDTTPTTGSDTGGNGIPHDPADQAHRRMTELLRTVTQDAAELAKLVAHWTPDRWNTHEHTPAEAELARIDDGLWCPNHLRHGHREVRDTANRRTLCRWCYGIQHDTGITPDRELIERHARMTRITTRDLDGFKARNAGTPKKRKKGAA